MSFVTEAAWTAATPVRYMEQEMKMIRRPIQSENRGVALVPMTAAVVAAFGKSRSREPAKNRNALVMALNSFID